MRFLLALPALLLLFAASCTGTSPDRDAVVIVETLPAEPAPAPSVTPDGAVTIAAVGDVMLARDLIDLMDANGALYPFERVAPLLRAADLTIANMEGTFTDRGTAADKLYTFRTPPRLAAGLAQAGIDLVSLGNNHAMDFGAEGLDDTLAALTAAGVLYAGAGPGVRDARSAVVLTVDGVRLAFLSYNAVTEATFAGPGTPGVAEATLDAIDADVRTARGQVDAVIVSLHAGVEYTDAPQPRQQQLARAAVDAGALLVLGHHAHTLQGWEEYGGGFIVYGLGNFVFDLDADDLEQLGPRAFESAVFYITISPAGYADARAEPVVIDVVENRPRPATPEEAAAILARLDDLHEIAGGP